MPDWQIAPNKKALVEITDDGSITWMPTADEQTPWSSGSAFGPDPITTDELIERLDGAADAAQEVIEAVREEEVKRFTERTETAAGSASSGNYEEARAEIQQAANDHLKMLEALNRISGELG